MGYELKKKIGIPVFWNRGMNARPQISHTCGMNTQRAALITEHTSMVGYVQISEPSSKDLNNTDVTLKAPAHVISRFTALLYAK